MKITITVISCSLLVLLFSYTAVSKFIDMDGFANDLHNQPFPKWLSSILIYLLPVMELAIAGMLIFEKSRIIGLWVSMILMSLFTVYTFLVLSKVFYKVPCSCGGVIRNLTWGEHMMFNLFFVFVSIAAIKLCMHQTGQSRKPV